jgi:hypothetical protein
MRLNFNISEFVIDGKPVPVEITDKILHYHIMPLQAVRNALGVAIWPSQNSGYRSKEWELSHGRSGNSQHCFKGKGAVDLTFSGDIDKLLDAVIEHTEYTRMAVYYDNNTPFIHCDYKSDDGKRYVYKSTPASNWTFIKNV